MKKNPLFWLVCLGLTLSIVVIILVFSTLHLLFKTYEKTAEEGNIGVLEVTGIIIEAKKSIEILKQYETEDRIKGIIVRLNSPGGVVGPSQEIYDEIKRIKSKKPIVVSMGSLAASGAYYIACAANTVVANPGTLTGSIGVILEFINLSKLYEWAKMNPYVLKSGKYKDIGSSYRDMTEAERALLQKTIDTVHDQFKKAVSKGRHIPLDLLDTIADGRIFSGEQAVKLGLVDALGGMQKAIALLVKEAHIEDEPLLTYPKKKRSEWVEMVLDNLVPAPFQHILKNLSQRVGQGHSLNHAGVQTEQSPQLLYLFR